MVFASRRTWVDVDLVYWILEEDGYRPIKPEAVCPGDLLVYNDPEGPTHIGVVWQHEPDVERATWRTDILSQWGAAGEYFHESQDVAPLLGTPQRFWTDRSE